MKGFLAALLILVSGKEIFARPQHDLVKSRKELHNRPGTGSGLRTLLVSALDQMSDEQLLNTLQASVDLRIRICAEKPGKRPPRSSAPPPTDRPVSSTIVFSTKSAGIKPTKKPIRDAPRREQSEAIAKMEDEPHPEETTAPDQSTTAPVTTVKPPMTMPRTATPEAEAEAEAEAATTTTTTTTTAAAAAEEEEEEEKEEPKLQAVVEWDNELERLAQDEGDSTQAEAAMSELKELADDDNDYTNGETDEWSNDDGDSENEKSESLVAHDELNSDAGEFESIMTIGAQATEDQGLPREEEANNWVGIELFKKPKVKDKKNDL